MKMLSNAVLSMAVCFFVLCATSSNVKALTGCDRCEGDCSTKVPVQAGGTGCNGGTCTHGWLSYCEDKDGNQCGCAPSQDVDENGNDKWVCTCQ